MSDYHVDYEAMMQQIKNHAMIDLLLSMIPDKRGKEQVSKFMAVFVRNGVPVDKAATILVELSAVIIETTKRKETEVDNDA